MHVRIVTDTSANVPEEYLARLHIIEAPAVINFGQDSYLYKVEMPLEAFYQRLAATDRLPTTAQPSPQQFLAAYQRAADEGAGEILAITVSSKVSGTYNSAVLAADQSPVPVRVFDTLHVSMAAGWQVIAAAERVAAAEQAGEAIEVEALLHYLEGLRRRVHMAFTPLNLKYLIASGRAPRLSGTIGDLLNIKPVLVTVDGTLEPVARVRTQRKALEHMLGLVAAAVGRGQARVAVGHCNVPEDAAALAEQARAAMNVSECVIFDLGMLAALGGPGLLGLTAYALDEP